MDYLEVTHVAINVPDLREAEAYYALLFGLEVAWRDSNGAASMFASWDELDAARIEPEVVLLWSGAFRLALAKGEGAATADASGLNHVGLHVTPATMRTVRLHADATVGEGNESTWSFHDRYRVRWEIDTRSYADPREIIRAKARRLDLPESG